jgi:CubicO group peptidase (beta-lactamase class C family)
MTSVRIARFWRFAFSVAFGVTAFDAVADSPVPQLPLDLTADALASVVDPLMAEWIDKHKGPGAVVVVATRDAQVFAKGYGFSDIDARKPFTADTTLVRPGSISKLFTGIAVMQLVDAGRLDLDRDVNGYIDYAIPTPEGGVPVTLRRLLTHRAGFEEHVKGLFSEDREPEPLGRWLAKNLPLRLFPKGDVPAYSNYGVALAGYIVERVSGEPYASYIQRHILDPLRMSHSTFRQPLPGNLAPLMAKGYSRSDRPPLAFFETVPAPAGGLSATGTGHRPLHPRADERRRARRRSHPSESAARRDDGAKQRDAHRISRPRVFRNESGGPRLDRARRCNDDLFQRFEVFP